MEFLNELLPILLYAAGFVLLVVLIMVSLKINTMLDKVDHIIDDVETKVNSFDHAITLFSKTADHVAEISNSFVFGLTSTFSKLFKKKN